MQKLLYLFSGLILCLTLHGQKNVTLTINHFMGGEVFENEKEMKNDLGNDFAVDRLEYYLSSFTIIHDGGQELLVDDAYVLVSLLNSNAATTIELGQHDVDQIEGVRFYLGVDEEANHADPAGWPSDHPLAPKSPSMHWGWAAGYRFIALEGLSGPNLDLEMQLHIIGNQFFKPMTFEGSSTAEGYHLELDAHYDNLLNGIDLTSGMIIHGGQSKELSTVVDNLLEATFTARSTTSTTETTLVNPYTYYPNPSEDGQVFLSGNIQDIETMRLYDNNGRLIESLAPSDRIRLPNQGVYILHITTKDGVLYPTRLISI